MKENGEKKERERRKRWSWWMCVTHNTERWKEWKQWVSLLYFWLCSMAEHIKLGSNPSSQYLPHLVCYILHIFVNNTHTNAIKQIVGSCGVECEELLANKMINLGDLGYDTPSRKEKKMNEWRKWILVSFWRQAPLKHWRGVCYIVGCAQWQSIQLGSAPSSQCLQL